MIRERVIRLHYDDIALDFITDREIDEFQKAVGRVVAFGLRSKKNDGVEFIEANLSKFGDLTAAFYPPTAWGVDGASNAPFFALSTALDAFRVDDPTVIRAVPDGQGSYSVF